MAISSVTTGEPVVALTFDACATRKQANGFDRKVFEILVRDRIPATLYLSGRWVETTKKALPDIIAGLREKGLRFVTVSQLLALPDAVPVEAKPSRFGYGPRNKRRAKERGEDHDHPPT